MTEKELIIKAGEELDAKLAEAKKNRKSCGEKCNRGRKCNQVYI